MTFKIDVINILIFSVMFVNSTYGVLVYLRNKKDAINFSFFILTLTISAWGIAMFGYRGFSNHSTVLLMSKLLYFTAITIPTAFIYFVKVFPNHEVKLNKYQKYLLPLPMILLCIASVIPDLFIRDVLIFPSKETFIVFNPLAHIFFGIYVVSYFSWAYIIVLTKYFKAKNILKVQLGYIFVGTISSTIITLITNLTLLYFGYFNLNWVGQIGILVMITFIFYSITRHKLFNIRLITAQLFTLFLCTFIIIRIFLATNSREVLLEAILLCIVIIFGTSLIRSALHEIQQRERIEKLAVELNSLNSHLSEKVAEQTHEIKKAYELEKKARRDLEKLNETKDQFIMITQHNLRTPVTSIRWELESILSGAHGEMTEELRSTLEDTSTSVHRLIRIVDDFLNITALKVGSQILNLSSESLLPLLESVIKELRIDIDEMHLKIDYPKDLASWPHLKIDRSKIQEVLLIVIENAVRYNVDRGHIAIENHIEDALFEITVKNTGVGITDEERNKLFDRLFYRGKRAQAKNPTGMGIGLSVAKAVLKAHHGDIVITSDGEGQGAKVVITLPFDFINEIS